jgi:uncharacterized membrane protein
MRRSIAKAVSYRLLSSAVTITTVFVMTGSRTVALSLGGFDIIAKLIGYILHERAWIWIDRRKAARNPAAESAEAPGHGPR